MSLSAQAPSSAFQIRRVSSRKRVSYLTRIRILAFACGLPGFLAALLLLLLGDFSSKVFLTVLILVTGAWLAVAFHLQARIVRPLQIASNMLSALREGDFSLRPGNVDPDDPLGQIMLEIDTLSTVLQENRIGAIEALGLLNKVVDNVNVGVFTFDPDNRLRLVNRTGLRILHATDGKQVIGRPASELALAPALAMLPPGADPRNPAAVTIDRQRYAVRLGSFRESGKPHRLLLLTDVSQQLRDEERTAWKRLIRVMGHEINNSLTPIRSIASSIDKILKNCDLDEETREDVEDGLEVITTRVDGLSRFMQEYSRLAKLPPPHLRPTPIAPLVERVAQMSTRMQIQIHAGPPVVLPIDPDQIEQLLINILKNAVEASLETRGSVSLAWNVNVSEGDKRLEITILDEGHGIANPDNLFIPFFTTKQGGSGIGLTLSRQIAESHNGQLSLENRDDRSGCRAVLILPFAPGKPESPEKASWAKK